MKAIPRPLKLEIAGIRHAALDLRLFRS